MNLAASLHAQIQALRAAVEAALSGTTERPRAQDVPWTPGQRLTAQVEAELPGGRYQIRIGAFPFDVELPVKAQVGDRLRLEFLSTSPRVVFALLPDAGADAPESVAMGQSQRVEISSAARTLIDALQTTRPTSARIAPPQPTPIRDPLPLLPAPPLASGLLAAALQRAVDRSGLFYEAHLLQWFTGERPLAALLREPQGHLSRPPAAAPMAGENGSADSPRTLPTPANAAPDPKLGNAVPGEARPGKSVAEAQPSFHPQTLTQIRSQLDLLEQRQIVWHGQAWPGQPLEWRIEEPPQRAHAPDEPVPWSTHLRLTLPRLGEVSAELTLARGGVQLRLTAQSAAAAADLQDGRSALVDALEDAGIGLSGFVVRTQ